MTLFRPIVSAATSALALAAVPALADVALPAPYVSRALDAVLLPIDANVRDAFALGASDTGVLVLTTEPGGVADANGILPGDVLSVIGGRKVSKPLDVDTIVYYWILDGVTDFEWSLLRGGDTVEVYTLISEESYWEVIDVTTIETWSITEEVSFSYEEYWSEYSEEITESYESSETLIEETVISEEFTSEVEESYEEAEEFTEEEMSEETTEEVSDESEDMADDDTGDDGFEDEMADDGTEEDMAEDEAVEEDAGDDMTDDGGDDAGDDSGGDE